MTIDKLKSGNYRIRQMVNGQRVSITLDHKPKKNEAEALIQEMVKKPAKRAKSMLLSDACKAYNEAKSNIIAPSTIRGYDVTIRTIPAQYNKYISEYNSALLQALSNEWSKELAPKTVRNRISYIHSVLSYFEIELRPATIPKDIKEELEYIPTEEEVAAVLDYMKDTKYWVATMLAVQGLRRSEILALGLDDLVGNELTINKAMVPNTDEKYIIKSTKTSASTRKIIIPDSVADRIREQGFIYEGDPGGIRKNLIRCQKALGIQHFKLHTLRHFFASFMNGKLTDKQIAELGGWRDGSRVMKLVYQHALRMDEAKREAASLTEKMVSDWSRKN